MARVIVQGNIKTGRVYECIFGLFRKRPTEDECGTADEAPLTTPHKAEASDDDYNYRIPNELVKKRAVVVLGSHKGQYIVVPISSTQGKDKKPRKIPENLGIHIRLGPDDLPSAGKYCEQKPRWAKCDLITTVDGGRLRDIYDAETRSHVAPAHSISEETLLAIRYGVMRCIGLGPMVPTEAGAEARAEAGAEAGGE